MKNIFSLKRLNLVSQGKKIIASATLLLALALNVKAQNITVTPSKATACEGDTISLVANDTLGVNYQWYENGSPIDTSIVVGGLNAANNDTIYVVPTNGTKNYLVTAYDSSGNPIGFSNTPATVTVNANPMPTANNNGPYCENDIIKLQSNGGIIYNWSGPNGFLNNQQNPTPFVATMQDSGKYFLTATNSNGCSATDSTVVTVNPLPTPAITASQDTVCVGGQILLSSSGGQSYLWSDGSTSSLTSILASLGTNPISVTATDVNGCSATVIKYLFGNPNPALSAGANANTSCFGGNDGIASINATGGSPFTYLWNTGDTTQSITGLTTGNYWVTVTNVFACTNQGGFTVNEPSQLTAIDTTINVSCFGANDGQIIINTPTGGIAPYQYRINGGSWSSVNTFNNLIPGTYLPEVRDTNNCLYVLPVVAISEPTVLNSSTSSLPANCFGDSNGSAFVTPTGGTAPYTYNWSDGQTTNPATGLASNGYTVSVTDNNGCINQASVAVNQPSQLQATSTTSNVSCFAGNDGSLVLSAVGGTAPYEYRINGGSRSTANTFNNLTSGNYIGEVRDTNKCVFTLPTISISQPALLSSSAISTPDKCFGDSNGSATVLPTGGTAPYSYVWNNGDTNQTASTLAAGLYQYTITDKNNCVDQNTISVSQPNQLFSVASSADVSCFGGNDGHIVVNLPTGGTAPYQYRINGGPLSSVNVFSNLTPGTYIPEVMDANNCSFVLPVVTISEPPFLNASAGSLPANCFGDSNGSAFVTPTGGTAPYTYNWSDGQTINPATGLPAGGYSVTTTDAHGCTQQSSVAVNQPSQLQATSTITQNIACTGNTNGSATVNAVGGTPNYSYLWSNGSPMPFANGLTNGTYTVTVTDANGCTATTSAIITALGSNLYVNLTSNPGCGNNGNIIASVSGGQQPYGYSWSNGATSPSITGLSSGNYGVTITDANGCYWQGSQTIQGNPAITLNLVDQILCDNNTTLIHPPFTGGTWPYQFTWTTPSGNISTAEQINPTEDGNYVLTITDNFGCSASDTMDVQLKLCNNGIDEFSESHIQTYPNPVKSGSTVTIQDIPVGGVELSITNILGQVVYNEQSHQNNIHFSANWAPGLYTLKIKQGDKIMYKKIIVD